MILKIKIRYDQTERRYYSTNIFFASEFINSLRMNPILLEIAEYVKINDLSEYVQNKNEIHFKIEDAEEGYVNLGPVKAHSFSRADIEDVITRSCNTHINEIIKTRQRKRIIPRAVIYAASMYFGRISSLVLEDWYMYDHASILHLVNKSLPSSVMSGEPLAISLIKLVAERYGDPGFKTYCSTFRGRSKEEHSVDEKYKGVWSARGGKFAAGVIENGKKKMIGTFQTRFAANQAYREYLKQI